MDPYAELALLILRWDLVKREGTQAQKSAVYKKMHAMADTLRGLGYDVKWRGVGR